MKLFYLSILLLVSGLSHSQNYDLMSATAFQEGRMEEAEKLKEKSLKQCQDEPYKSWCDCARLRWELAFIQYSLQKYKKAIRNLRHIPRLREDCVFGTTELEIDGYGLMLRIYQESDDDSGMIYAIMEGSKVVEKASSDPNPPRRNISAFYSSVAEIMISRKEFPTALAFNNISHWNLNRGVIDGDLDMSQIYMMWISHEFRKATIYSGLGLAESEYKQRLMLDTGLTSWDKKPEYWSNRFYLGISAGRLDHQAECRDLHHSLIREYNSRMPQAHPAIASVHLALIESYLKDELLDSARQEMDKLEVRVNQIKRPSDKLKFNLYMAYSTLSLKENNPELSLEWNQKAISVVEKFNEGERLEMLIAANRLRKKAYVALNRPDEAIKLHFETIHIDQRNYCRNSAFLTDYQLKQLIKNQYRDFQMILSSLESTDDPSAYSELIFNQIEWFEGRRFESLMALQNWMMDAAEFKSVSIESANTNQDEILLQGESPELMWYNSIFTQLARMMKANEEGEAYSGNRVCPDTLNSFEDYEDCFYRQSPNKCIVKFVHFEEFERDWTGETIYGAFVIRGDLSTPVYIELFREDEILRQTQAAAAFIGNSPKGKDRGIVRANSSQLTADSALYHMMWGPLESYIQDVDTIGYSLSGRLNSVAMDALHTGDSLFGRTHVLQRYLATRTAIEPAFEPRSESIVLMGGVQHDYVPEDTLAKVSTINQVVPDISGAIEDYWEGWNFLEGAHQEVLNISETFKGSEVTLLVGNNASEEAFKKLSGHSPHVIHVASHGFFFQDVAEAPKSDPIFKFSRDPLMRSGLILSGANYAWQHGSNPYEEEDGILTAYEISHLDLSNTDLVVLSACETGLGEVQGSEGVFGLQRAFKMAGVDYIIMSLWKVPDEPTREFMELFYDNWLGGEPIRDAFRNTQRTMSEKYDPYEWAAFVLVE